MAGGIDFPNTPIKNQVFFYTDPVTGKVNKWLFNGNSWVLQEWAMEEAPGDGLQYARAYDLTDGVYEWQPVIHTDPDVKEAPASDQVGDPLAYPIYARRGPTLTTDPILKGTWVEIQNNTWAGLPTPVPDPEGRAKGHNAIDWANLVEFDIVDLDKYTQQEVQDLITAGVDNHGHDVSEISGLGAMAVEADAPLNEEYHLRQNGAWAQVVVRPVELRESMSISYPEDTDDATLFWTAKALTVIGMFAHVKDANADVTFNVLHAATRDSTGDRVLQGTNVVCNSTAGQGYSSWDVNSIPANSWVWINIGSVANQQALFHVTVTYVEDDVVNVSI